MKDMEFENEPHVLILAYSVEPRRVVRAQLAEHSPGVPDIAWAGSAALSAPEELAAFIDDYTNFAGLGYRQHLNGFYDITCVLPF